MLFRHQQLTAQQKESFTEIKNALLSAFSLDKFQAYGRLVERKKQNGEPVDVYLAELRRMASQEPVR